MGVKSGQEGVGGVIIKGHRENLGSDEYIMAMVSRVNTYIKISQIEHFKYVQCIRESIFKRKKIIFKL